MKRKKVWFMGLVLLTAMILIFGGHEPSAATLNLPAQAEDIPQIIAGRSGVTVATATTINNSSETISAPRVSLREQPYKDPQGRFEVGILENYKVSAIADAPLIESPDGTMAYTVVVQPKITNQQFTNEALAQMAINQFQRGEGFQPNQLEVLAAGEILIPWTGTVTIGRNTQPISGSILVRQNQDKIVMLLLSAMENAIVESPRAIATLSDSLKSL